MDGSIMTKPINLYVLSRITEKKSFNIMERHFSQNHEMMKSRLYEIESLRKFTDECIKNKVQIADLDGFFYSFRIPHIGKEFDLLKISDSVCLNIELKSEKVPEDKILNQLLKNRYYLSCLGKQLLLYSINTDEMKCYMLSEDDKLVSVEFKSIVSDIKRNNYVYIDQIESIFDASNYLISPLNAPDKFIRGEYFLTLNQEQVKKELLKTIDDRSRDFYFHITGKPGSGKTLLLYDIAITLSKTAKTLIVHCGKTIDGQRIISNEIENLDIICAKQLDDDNFSLHGYEYILVDESHRIYKEQFNTICFSASNGGKVCIFSSDPEQVLSATEKENDIAGRIKKLSPYKEYKLSEKIRTNKELYSFITCMMRLTHKPKKPMNFSNVSINYANTSQEAKALLEYYKAKGYVFINYSKSNFAPSPYSEYKAYENYDTHHVIGQEFDKIVMLMDNSFFYDKDGVLQGQPHPNPDYLYRKLFYQGSTRAREELALIVINAPELFEKITSIVDRFHC